MGKLLVLILLKEKGGLLMCGKALRKLRILLLKVPSGDGKWPDISFWHDWWCGDPTLVNMVRNDHIDTDTNLEVACFLDENSGWNKNLFAQVLSSGVNMVMATPHPMLINERIGSPVWGINPNGKFTGKSVMDRILTPVQTHTPNEPL